MIFSVLGYICSAGNTPANQEYYSVDEVFKILSPTSFQCKLSENTAPPSVRYTVQLREVESQGDPSEQYKRLAGILDTAHAIELRNVRHRNYFRIEADLWINGKDVTPLLLANGWTKADATPPLDESSAPAVMNRQSYLTTGPGIKSSAPNRRSFRRAVNVQQLLNMPVDCTTLDSEMPLGEALEILSDSVNPRLPLLVLWRDLEANAFIEKDTPIGIEGFGYMRLGQVLGLIYQSISTESEKPVMVLEGGILTLGTRQTLIKNKKTMEMKVYYIADLLQAPSVGGLYQALQSGMEHGF